MKPIITQRSYRGLLWSLVLVGLALDLSSKYGVFAWLYNDGLGSEYVVLPGVFELMAQFIPASTAGDHPLSALRSLGGEAMPRVNHGALFGLACSQGILANSVFAVVSILAALAIAYWSTLPSTVSDPPLCAALGLILGGTLGNLFDRLVFNGVRDFIHWHYYELVEWPVFNIADCCLVCGAGLLLLQAFWSRPVSVEQTPLTVSATEMATAR